MKTAEEAAKRRLRRALAQRLASLQRAGVTELIKPPGKTAGAAARAGADEAAQSAAGDAQRARDDLRAGPPRADAAGPRPPAGVAAATTQQVMFDEGREPTPRLSLPERREALAIIQREVAACRRCRQLANTRTQTVFGTGSPQARVCFLGEAPGVDEDRQGEPFVGRAGQLLTKIIEACTLRREDVYILNILKCRPPDNRTPTAREAGNCMDFLHRQLGVIQPELICCLGSVAAANLLETTQSVGRLRGKFHLYRGTKVLVTYHPAYLLRNPAAKRQVWEDMKMLMRELGIEIPSQYA